MFFLSFDSCIILHRFLKRFYLYSFREKGKEGEREGEKHRWGRETSIGCFNPACYSAICPDQELNRQPFGLQDNAQPTEPHGQGYIDFCF